MAKRITKTMALNAASNMAKMYLRDELKQAKVEMSNYATSIVYAIVPKEVLDTTEKYKDYIYGSFSTGLFAYIDDIRRSAICTPIECRIPSGCEMLEVDEKTYKNISKLKKALTTIENKRAQFREEMKNALYSLGTKENVEKTFPNAIKYIDFGEDKKKNLPVSNYSMLKNIMTTL